MKSSFFTSLVYNQRCTRCAVLFTNCLCTEGAKKLKDNVKVDAKVCASKKCIHLMHLVFLVCFSSLPCAVQSTIGKKLQRCKKKVYCKDVTKVVHRRGPQVQRRETTDFTAQQPFSSVPCTIQFASNRPKVIHLLCT